MGKQVLCPICWIWKRKNRMESRGNKNVYYHSVLLAFLKWNRFVIPMKSRILNKDEYDAQSWKKKRRIIHQTALIIGYFSFLIWIFDWLCTLVTSVSIYFYPTHLIQLIWRKTSSSKESYFSFVFFNLRLIKCKKSRLSTHQVHIPMNFFHSIFLFPEKELHLFIISFIFCNWFFISYSISLLNQWDSPCWVCLYWPFSLSIHPFPLFLTSS